MNLRPYVLVGTCFLLLSPAHAKDAIEIIDLASGTTQTLPCVINSDEREELLACDDEKRCVYTLRREKQRYTLRSIGYDAKLVEQQPLPNFQCKEAYFTTGSQFICALSSKADRIIAGGGPKGDLFIYTVADHSVTPIVADRIDVLNLFWLSDDTAIAVIGGDKPAEIASSVILVDTRTGKTEVAYKDDSLVWGGEVAALSPDKRYLATYCSSTDDVRIVDLQNKQLAARHRLRRHNVDQMCWNPDGKSLAYNVPTDGRIDVSSVSTNGEITDTKSHEVRDIVWGMFYLDPTKVACLKGKIDTSSGSGKPRGNRLEILNVSSGQWDKSIPNQFGFRVDAIDSGKKLISIFSDGRGNRASLGPVPMVGGHALALALPILMQSMLAAGREPGASVGIINVEKGDVKVVKDPGAWMENLLAVDEAQKRFATLHVTEKETSVRTISFAGDVLETKVLPGMRITGGQGLLRFTAYSMETGVFAYYDDVQTKALYTIDLKTEQKEQILSDLDVELFHLAWVDDKRLVLVINADWSDSEALANSIALLDTETKKLEVLNKGKEQFDSIGPAPFDYYPRNSFKLSPDRSKFLFSQQGGMKGHWSSLLVLDIKTKEVRSVAPKEDEVFTQYACWDAKGERIAYVEMKRTRLSMERELRSGNMYDVENSVKLYAGGQTNVTVFTSHQDWLLHNLAFLDKSRLLLGFEAEGWGGGRSVVLIDGESNQTKKLLKGKFVTNMIAVDGGKLVLCHI